ncbi:MAG: hypothetical protein OSB09_09510 [Planctomycetota bacterium]|nr:hypothetical protein [Planctomycetota bacterium]
MMASNPFRLGTLLRIRKQQVEEHLKQMACCIGRLDQQRKVIGATEEEYQKLVSQLRSLTSNEGAEMAGATHQDRMVHRRYLERLRDQAKDQDRIAQEMSDHLNLVRAEVEEALNRCRIVEQLKIQSETRERERTTRKVQKQLDEQNTTRFAGEIQSDSA